MATERRRETLIALRARRTAHRVASDVVIFQHSKPLTIDCVECRRSFLPMKDETVCPNCIARSPISDWQGAARPGWLDQPFFARPTPGQWLAVFVVFSLFALSLWGLFHTGMH